MQDTITFVGIDAHTEVRGELEQLVQNLVLGDWRYLDLEKEIQHMLALKRRYLSAHFADQAADRLSALATLDEILITLYLCLDSLHGQEDQGQRAHFYRALAQVQYPLLQALALLPASRMPEFAPTVEGSKLDEKPTPGPFRWSPEMVHQLRQAYAASAQQTVTTKIQEIVQRYGWPRAKVTYKVFSLRLNEQSSTAQEANADVETEGD